MPAEKEKKPFRFLDLPPEMRNRLYRDLLVNHTPHQGVHTEILRLNKEINSEAKDIIKESTISFKFNATETDDMQHIFDITVHLHTAEPQTVQYQGDAVHNGVWGVRAATLPLLEMPEGMGVWPDYLSTIERLRIHIVIESNDAVKSWAAGDDEYWTLHQINHLLFSLASYFEWRGHRLQHLSVEVQMKPPELEERDGPAVWPYSGAAIYTGDRDPSGNRFTMIQRVLWPLGRIGWVKNLNISGLSPENEGFFQEKIKASPSNYRENRPTKEEQDKDEDQNKQKPNESSQNEADSHDAPTNTSSTTDLSAPVKAPGDNTELPPSVTAALSLPNRPDLGDRLWWLYDEAQARHDLLPVLHIDVPDNDTQAPPGERSSDDPVQHALMQAHDSVYARSIDACIEEKLSGCLDGFKDALDEFRAKVGDGRVEVWEEMRETEEYVAYEASHKGRVQAWERFEEKARLRKAGWLRSLPWDAFDAEPVGRPG